MWSVVVDGNYACCADTHNGIFLIDISNKNSLKSRGYYKTLTGGVAFRKGYIYGACVNKGLMVFDANIQEPQVSAISNREKSASPTIDKREN